MQAFQIILNKNIIVIDNRHFKMNYRLTYLSDLWLIGYSLS